MALRVDAMLTVLRSPSAYLFHVCSRIVHVLEKKKNNECLLTLIMTRTWKKAWTKLVLRVDDDENAVFG